MSPPDKLHSQEENGPPPLRSWLVCPVCRSSQHRDLWKHQPARSIDGKVVECTKCGTMFKIPDDIGKGVAEYYTDERHTASYAALHDDEDHDAAMLEFKEILERVSARLSNRRGRLLDLGCGPGAFLEMAQKAGFDVSGVEINPVAAKTARQRTGGQVFTADLDVDRLPGKAWDFVTLLDLIEHVQDPVALLERTRAVLAQDGYLIVFTPNHASLIVKVARALDALSGGRFRGPIDHIFDCVHVTFFTVDTLRKAIEAAGFRVVAVDLIRYRPERRKEADVISAAALRALEFVSKFVPDGRFRTLMIGIPMDGA